MEERKTDETIIIIIIIKSLEVRKRERGKTKGMRRR